MRALEQETDVCVTVTLVDGLVLARLAFHHSISYRSVVIFGKARIVSDETEKFNALRAFTEHLVPHRWAEIRQPGERRRRLPNERLGGRHPARNDGEKPCRGRETYKRRRTARLRPELQKKLNCCYSNRRVTAVASAKTPSTPESRAQTNLLITKRRISRASSKPRCSRYKFRTFRIWFN